MVVGTRVEPQLREDVTGACLDGLLLTNNELAIDWFDRPSTIPARTPCAAGQQVDGFPVSTYCESRMIPMAEPCSARIA
jgi:hypothetical protein